MKDITCNWEVILKYNLTWKYPLHYYLFLNIECHTYQIVEERVKEMARKKKITANQRKKTS